MTILQQFNITSIALIELDTSAGSSSYALPDITPFQQGVLVKDATGNAGTNNVTITPPSGLLIDGTATYVLSANYQSVLFVSDGLRVIAGLVDRNGTGIFNGRLTVNLNAAALPDPDPNVPVRVGASDGNASLVVTYAFGNLAGFVGARADGTGATPSKVLANDEIAAFGSGGYTGASWAFGAGGFSVHAESNWSTTSTETWLGFSTVANGALPPAVQRANLKIGFMINSAGGVRPTGGDMGPGSINIAGNYYVNGAQGTAGTATPGNPAGTTSLTGLMMGLAASFTPATRGVAVLMIAGNMQNNTNADGVGVQLRYGTGTAPTNGAAPTGTAAGQAQSAFIDTANNAIGFCIPAVAVLSPGTTYWIDARVNAVTGGTASIANITVTAFELTL